MKTTSNFVNLVLIGILALFAFSATRPQATAQASPTPSAASAESGCDSARSLQVSGSATVNVTPDRALIQLGVQSTGATPDAVQNANFQQIQKVIAAARALGVDAKDIATDYFIVYPVYENYNSLAIKGYRIDNTVSITLRSVGLVDDLIIAALKVGANEVQDLQFYTSELRKYRDQTRALAMTAAGEKAQALAGAAGTQAGCVLSISENIASQYYGYYGSWRGGRDSAQWTQNVVQNAAPGASAAAQPDDAPISLGQIAIRAEVSARYGLK
jgi:uncharacterized protein YggE